MGLPIEAAFGDCGDSASVEEAVKEVDLIFHLAGVTKATAEKTYFEVNALGTENLIRATLKNNPEVQKFIYLSSQAAAGPCLNGDRKRESDSCQPVSAYGRSKRRGEELALALADKIPLVILRPSAVYGPRERDIYTFFKLLSRKIKPSLCAEDQHLSLCYVDDIVQAVLLAAQSHEPSGEIFFLSDGHDYPMKEVGDVFAQAMGVNAFSIRVPKWTMIRAASISEYFSKLSRRPPLLSKGKVEEILQRNWVCDITKARTALGFEPRIPLRQGAELTYQWYKREKWL
jgi:nucleoside-diphosphate-sugar epimerase